MIPLRQDSRDPRRIATRPSRRRSADAPERKFAPTVVDLEERALLSLQPTMTSITATAGTAVYGRPIVFTATVTDAPPGTATPTGGTVTFSDGATVLGTQPLVNGAAVLSISTLQVGGHSVTASYSGDGANFAASDSATETGVITTVAGNGKLGYTGDGGPATAASLYSPEGVAVDGAGNLFIADTYNSVIREVVKATGEIITVAGNHKAGYTGDGGPATAASLDGPMGVAVDGSGNLLIADTYNNVIREVVKATGDIITVAGNGKVDFQGEQAFYVGDGGPATSAEIYFPEGLAVDGAGNVFFSDENNSGPKTNYILEVVKATGIIITVTTDVYDPTGVALDGSGDLFIGNNGDFDVLELKASGELVTVADVAGAGGVAVDGSGDLFFADFSSDVVREMIAVNGDIITVSGKGNGGFGVALDQSGHLFIADTGNNRIQELTLSKTSRANVVVTPAPLSIVVVSATKMYGDALPALTGRVTGILNGDKVTVDYATTANSSSDVVPGGYPITVAGLSGAQAGDYSYDPAVAPSASITPGVLTITPAPLKVVVDDQTRAYGQDNPPLTGQLYGAAPGFVTVIYSTTATRFSDVQAGCYPITVAGFTYDDVVAADYSDDPAVVPGAGVTPGVLTITPVEISIAVDNKSRLYGQPNPPFTSTVYGLLNGDDVTVDLTTTATPRTGVLPGGFPIIVAGLSGAKGVDYYYDPSYDVAPGYLDIQPAPLTIVADSKSRPYGQPNPTLTASYIGLIDGDTPTRFGDRPTLMTTATITSPVGNYPILVGGASSYDYTISYIDGTLSVVAGGGSTGGGGSGGGGSSGSGGGSGRGGGTVVAPAPALTGEIGLTAGTGRKKKVVAFELFFSAPLDAAVAVAPGHYRVTQPGRKRRGAANLIPIRSIAPGPGDRSVTLVLGKYDARKPLTLTATGLVGADGTPAGEIITDL
jgi:uncharacterized membrane protein YgcG